MSHIHKRPFSYALKCWKSIPPTRAYGQNIISRSHSVSLSFSTNYYKVVGGEFFFFGARVIPGSRVIFVSGGGGGVSPEPRVQGPVRLSGYSNYLCLESHTMELFVSTRPWKAPFVKILVLLVASRSDSLTFSLILELDVNHSGLENFVHQTARTAQKKDSCCSIILPI